jgi:tRNA nucleotidyltransferase/poly(A) polymerase
VVPASPRQNQRVPTTIRKYVRSLGLDAYVVGGAVRDELLGIPHTDEDFLVPGVDQDALRAALAPHGRVEDMEVHGQLVGVRFYPRDADVRALAPAGIELTPPRAERSTGPGHRDFEIVSDPSIGIEADMKRRDFTINAMAKRLATGELVDPFGGLTDLARRELRTVTASSFREDPLRILRGLRLVSQLGFTPAGATLAQMRLEAEGLRHVSAERIGGGVVADGMGELSKLLLGTRPEHALRLARDTGVLVQVLPEFEPVIGLDLGSKRQPETLDEHLFSVVQNAADNGAALSVRLAALLHDLGKPAADRDDGHAKAGAAVAGRVLSRLRYPTALRRRVRDIVAAHSFHLDDWLEPGADGRLARRSLLAHGEQLAADLVAHKRADLQAKRIDPRELEALQRLEEALEAERGSPYRLSELAVDGGDLLAIGFTEGPELGRVLHVLLEEVVEDPARNEPEWLVERARTELS